AAPRVRPAIAHRDDLRARVRAVARRGRGGGASPALRAAQLSDAAAAVRLPRGSMSERLVTRVGRALWGDNRFRGFSVGDELAGATDLWSLVALAVGHRPLGADECAILDDLAACGCAADPRIWPLKAVRLGSAYGRFTPGLVAGLLAIDGLHG